MAPRARHYGLGLRAQTLLALTAAFVLAFSALSIVVVQVAHKSQLLENQRRAAGLVEALAGTLPRAHDTALDASLARGATARDSSSLARGRTARDSSSLARGRTARFDARERAVAALIGRADVVGATARRRGPRAHTPVSFGDTSGRAAASELLPDGERLSIWMRAREPEAGSPLGRLLRLYALLTGALILGVVYVALTRLIVRPVENLTLAVERAKPELLTHDDAISIAGAAEVVRLGVAFNALARDLRLEKRGTRGAPARAGADHARSCAPHRTS